MTRSIPMSGLMTSMVVLIAVGTAALVAIPPAIHSLDLVSAADDPDRLSEIGLRRVLTPARLDQEVTNALDADDVDLATSLERLGVERGIAPASPTEARLRAATTPGATLKRDAGAFYGGVVNGDAASGAGFAGTLTGDLIGIGDLRDLAEQGGKIANGEEADRLVLGLAAAGIVVSGLTIASLGGALPIRSGLSTIKVLARSGRLSRPLALAMGRAIGDGIDRAALNRIASASSRLDLGAARQALAETIRPGAIARLSGLAADVSTLSTKAGFRATRDVLAIARDEREVSAAARLASARGPSTRGILKLLGRSALVVTSAAMTLVGWITGAVGLLWAAALLVAGLLTRSARLIALVLRSCRTAWRQGLRSNHRKRHHLELVELRDLDWKDLERRGLERRGA